MQSSAIIALSGNLLSNVNIFGLIHSITSTTQHIHCEITNLNFFCWQFEAWVRQECYFPPYLHSTACVCWASVGVVRSRVSWQHLVGCSFMAEHCLPWWQWRFGGISLNLASCGGHTVVDHMRSALGFLKRRTRRVCIKEVGLNLGWTVKLRNVGDLVESTWLSLVEWSWTWLSIYFLLSYRKSHINHFSCLCQPLTVCFQRNCSKCEPWKKGWIYGIRN